MVGFYVYLRAGRELAVGLAHPELRGSRGEAWSVSISTSSGLAANLRLAWPTRNFEEAAGRSGCFLFISPRFLKASREFAVGSTHPELRGRRGAAWVVDFVYNGPARFLGSRGVSLVQAFSLVWLVAVPN